MPSYNNAFIGRVVRVALAVAFAGSAPALAQWPKHIPSAVPKTSDGKPDMNAPAPRTPDGKPDLSGVWGIAPPRRGGGAAVPSGQAGALPPVDTAPGGAAQG